MEADIKTIWAITSFYNPVRYRSRLNNYKIFKANLNIPLITVELSSDDTFELHPDDADILIQVRSGSVLWHKERLLNIALSRLPKYVEYVAWLDCDIIFEDKDWYQQACLELKSKKMIQLFSHLFDLKPGNAPSDPHELSEDPTGYSIAYLTGLNKYNPEYFRPSASPGVRRGLFGLAWAAQRTCLEKCGFYDMMVIGSGDRAMACAGYGRFEDAMNVAAMSSIRQEHYLRWARQFYNLIQGNIGYMNNRLFHLWHGSISNRKYIERHKDFARLNFDPNIDLIRNKDGCWEWRNKFSQAHEFIKTYFRERHEDGPLEA